MRVRPWCCFSIPTPASTPAWRLLNVKACYIACGLTLAFVTPASATSFFVALHTSSNQCRIMVTEPDGQVMRKLGKGPYASYSEAEAAMRTMAECNITQ